MYVIRIGESYTPWDQYPDITSAEKERDILQQELMDKTVSIMTQHEFNQWLDTQLLSPAIQISEEVWWYSLEVLPPKEWHRASKPETFMMIEHLIGEYTEQFGRMDGIYLKKVIHTKKKETWITKQDFINLQPLQEIA